MDQRVCQWRSPWEKRTYLLCSLFYLCLLLRQHVTAAEAGYSQESKNDVPDSTKLDSLNSYIPYDSREDPDYKRSSAFFPLRGKKPVDESLSGHQLYMSDESEDKRSQFFPLRGKNVPDDLKRASYFMPMRGRKDDGWTMDEDYDITDESPNKRASSFMPMRGKKRYAAISDYLSKAGTYTNDVSEALNPSSSDSYRTADKRMHSFVPVRGKRSYEESESPNFQGNESSNHTASKRAVSFMPMRGRREFENDSDAPRGIATSLLEKKMQAFMPMRGRKDDDLDDSDEKRAQSFMPMRGRKNDDSDEKRAQSFMPMRGRKDDDSEAKRAQSFMPMRGRKDDDSGDDSDAKRAQSFMPMRGRKDDDSGDNSEAKRAQSFMPMRGRRAHLRDVVFESSDAPSGIESRLIEDKRASSFMPMRGRRSIPEDETASESGLDKRASSFTLMRGRRRSEGYSSEDEDLSDDEQKRMAFTPMRVRRIADDDEEDIDVVEPWQPDQLMSLFNKKASAFMPMRGRRFDYRNITVDPWPADELMSLFNKKSSAFLPMRGRRYDYRNITVDPWPADELMSLFNKKASAFMPMRGRRTMDYTDQDSDFSESWEKRGSSFTPMRGRRLYYPYPMAGMGSSLMSKPYSDQGVTFRAVASPEERRKKLRINWDAVKRAFHATRGKRQHDSLRDGSYSTDESDEHSRTKRSLMRQRIAMQPNRQYIALKRPMSFFATRGKRLDDSALDNLSKLR